MISRADYNIKKTKFRQIIQSEVYFLLLLRMNRSITKKFPIETLLEMIDSSIRNLGKAEYDRYNRLQQHVAKLRSRWLQWIFRTFPWFTTSDWTWFYDDVASSAYPIRLPQGFLCYNLFFPELFQLGTFLLWTDFCKVAIGGRSHFEFFRPNFGFLTLWSVLLIKFGFRGFLTLESTVFKTRLVGNFFVVGRFTYSGTGG